MLAHRRPEISQELIKELLEEHSITDHNWVKWSTAGHDEPKQMMGQQQYQQQQQQREADTTVQNHSSSSYTLLHAHRRIILNPQPVE